jgi:xylulose-5-phosphate/fructose-6-phosphate phosphoketolase
MNHLDEALSPYGSTRSTIQGTPLPEQELERMQAFWRASCYLMLGMIYLRENPLLREPLSIGQVKKRLLGHWGSSPGQAFLWIHLNRIIKKYQQDVVYVSGPGHGAPGILAPMYLEGTYTRFYPEMTQDAEGMRKFFRQFSFPGGIGSHCTPETPGSIHEGGELGYSLSHGFGIAFDNPNLIVATVVGDGEAETGPLATAWHSNKFLNPARDGAVLPILHLNGYKINSPTILARISPEELEALLRGYGYIPYFVEGSDPTSMHQALAATLDHCVEEIQRIWKDARENGHTARPLWPMIVFRTPKGWSAPRRVDGHYLEGFWRAHQVPLPGVASHPDQLRLLEEWMRSYSPHELFDQEGRPRADFAELVPPLLCRMSDSPHTNGGLLCRGLKMPAFTDYGVNVTHPGHETVENTRPLGKFLRDIAKHNPDNFRVFGPDETASNKLDDIYQVTKKVWMGEFLPDDLDGSELDRSGRVMEMLSEHTLEGWMEGYTLSGRHGFFSTYESFVHVIDSMVNQHAKWLEKSREVPWRADVPSINLLITSTVWRQDHNGFTHQDPGFLDVVANKSPDVVRIYLPPDANCLLSTADHCLRSRNYINVIVSDKQLHAQYLTKEEAIIHCTKGLGIWDWACTDEGVEPDVVLASAGDIPTAEVLAAIQLLKAEFPDLKMRYVNVVDLFRLLPESEHPHGLPNHHFDGLFTKDKPVIFDFHAYPTLIHRLTYQRTNHRNIHVRGYMEKGNINTPLELAIINKIDRFTVGMDVIDRVERISRIGAHAKARFLNKQLACRRYAYENGVDDPEVAGWTWPVK